MNIAQDVVVLRAFMGADLCDAAGAYDQYVTFH